MGKNSLKPPGAKGSKNIAAPSTAPSGGSTNHQNPTFCFRYLTGIDGYEHRVCFALAKMLRDLAQLTWQQIMCAPKRGMGHEKIGRDQIKVPLHAYTSELEHVLSFRVSGEWRLIGDRREGVLRILYAGPGAYEH